MEYAISLLLPIVGGLMLGVWLTRNFGVSPIWTVVLAILGLAGGIGVLAKRFAYSNPTPAQKSPDSVVSTAKKTGAKQPGKPCRHWMDLEKTEHIDEPLPEVFADDDAEDDLEYPTQDE